jgi:endogenous inhibitor of DNA gyrase (YacG/DUF329 family)
MADLGRWLGEEYRVPDRSVEPPADVPEDNESD